MSVLTSLFPEPKTAIQPKTPLVEQFPEPKPQLLTELFPEKPQNGSIAGPPQSVRQVSLRTMPSASELIAQPELVTRPSWQLTPPQPLHGADDEYWKTPEIYLPSVQQINQHISAQPQIQAGPPAKEPGLFELPYDPRKDPKVMASEGPIGQRAAGYVGIGVRTVAEPVILAATKLMNGRLFRAPELLKAVADKVLEHEFPNIPKDPDVNKSLFGAFEANQSRFTQAVGGMMEFIGELATTGNILYKGTTTATKRSTIEKMVFGTGIRLPLDKKFFDRAVQYALIWGASGIPHRAVESILNGEKPEEIAKNAKDEAVLRGIEGALFGGAEWLAGKAFRGLMAKFPQLEKGIRDWMARAESEAQKVQIHRDVEAAKRYKQKHGVFPDWMLNKYAGTAESGIPRKTPPPPVTAEFGQNLPVKGSGVPQRGQNVLIPPRPAPPAEIPAQTTLSPPAARGGAKEATPEFEKTSWSELNTKLDKLEIELDGKIDQLISSGKTETEAIRDKSLDIIYKERDAIAQILTNRYGNTIREVFSKHGYITKSPQKEPNIFQTVNGIIEDIYGVAPKGKWTPIVRISADNKAFLKPEITVKNLARDLFRYDMERQGLDPEGILGRDSAYTEIGKQKLLEKYIQDAQKIHNEITERFQKTLTIPERVPGAGEIIPPPTPIGTGQAKPYEAIVYRGIADKPADEGQYGKGTYFTTAIEEARIYGGNNIITGKVRLENPYIVKWEDAADIDIKSIIKDYGKHNLQDAEKASQEIRNKLESQGHDGIVIQHGNYNEIVVFEPKSSFNQIATPAEKQPKQAAQPPAGPPALEPSQATPGEMAGKKELPPDIKRVSEEIKAGTNPSERPITKQERDSFFDFLPESEQPLAPPPPQGEPLKGGRQSGSTTLIPDVAVEIEGIARKVVLSPVRIIRDVATLVKRNVKRGINHIKTLGEAGKQIAKDVDDITFRVTRNVGNDSVDIHNIYKGVSQKNREKIDKSINRPTKEKQPEWLVERANRLRAVLDRSMNEATALGMERIVRGQRILVGGSGKAFPEVPNKDGQRVLENAVAKGLGDPEVYKVAQYLVDTKQAKDIEGAVQKLQKYKDSYLSLTEEEIAGVQESREQQARGLNPYLESSRVELPEEYIEWDGSEILLHTLERNWMTIEGVRTWGKDFEKLAPQYEAIRVKNGSFEADAVKTFIDTSFGKRKKSSPQAQKISKAIRGYQFITKVATSIPTIIRNMTDRVAKGLIVGSVKNNIKATIKYPPFLNRWMKSARKIEDDFTRRGFIFGRGSLAEDFEAGGTVSRVVGKPFGGSEKGNQTYIALVKSYQLQDDILQLERLRGKDSRLYKFLDNLNTVLGTSEKQTKNRLNEYSNEDLANMLAKGEEISPELIDAIIHRTVRDKTFPVILSTKRMWWDNHPIAKMPVQFKTWPIEQTGLVWNEVIKDTVKTGNVAKFIRAIVGMALSGEIYNIIKDWLSEKDESLLNTLLSDDRTAKDVATALANDLWDGSLVGIFADVVYGLTSMALGPSGGTVKNVIMAGVHIKKNPRMKWAALQKLITQEVSAVRQAQAIYNKVDAYFNKNNITKEHYKWRTEGFKHSTDKKFKGFGGKLDHATDQMIWGYESFIPTERTLAYEFVARQVVVGDIDDAADYLKIILEGKKGEELKKTLTGIKLSMKSKSPLGKVAEKDLPVFLAKYNKSEQAEALKTHRKFLSGYEKALQIATNNNKKVNPTARLSDLMK